MTKDCGASIRLNLIGIHETSSTKIISTSAVPSMTNPLFSSASECSSNDPDWFDKAMPSIMVSCIIYHRRCPGPYYDAWVVNGLRHFHSKHEEGSKKVWDASKVVQHRQTIVVLVLCANRKCDELYKTSKEGEKGDQHTLCDIPTGRSETFLDGSKMVQQRQ
jgi:hypothetical protein